MARIARITLYRLEIPFRGVFRIATAEYARQPYVVCEVESDEGLVGYGEACPAYEFTGETGGTVVAAIRELLARKLLGRDPLDIEAVSDDLVSTCAGNPSAKAALETALYDLACKTLGIPLYRLLGGPVRRRLPLSGTIAIMPPDEASRRAAELAEGRVRVVKVKVGTDPRGDAERVRAVRDAVGSDVEIRVDANQGYGTVKRAREAIKLMERFDISLVEQPLPAHDLRGHAELRKLVDVPIMLDESVHSARDAVRAILEEACDVINIKLMKAGGIRECLRIADVARAAGVPCFMGGMGETTIGTSAAIHIQCSRAVIAMGDVSLPRSYLVDDIAEGLIVERGAGGAWVRLSDEPGLGVRVVREWVRRYMVEGPIVIS